MARTKRTTRKMRKTNVKRRSTSRPTIKLQVSSSVARELWALFYFVLGVLVILSIEGLFGAVGTMFLNLFSPIFGYGVFITPVFCFLIAGMLFFSKKIVFSGTKIFGLILMFVSILSILHISVPIESLKEFAQNGEYGGYVGFVTNTLFRTIFDIGTIGTAVVFVALSIASFMIFFDVSLKDVWTFIVPEIKIETVKMKSTSQKSKSISQKDAPLLLMAEDGQPEITIHKARLGSNSRKADVVIYEDDQLPEQMSINDLAVSEELSRNELETESSISYEWEFPSLDLLKDGDSSIKIDEKVLRESAETIRQKLKQFGINVVMREVNVGPTVIQYTLKPDDAVKLSKITGLKNDLALALAAERIRIEAPIPGKSLVGIEVPNKNRATVHLREILESSEFANADSKLTFPLGRDVSGVPIIGNLEEMPHLLIAGATGSGKSVAMNTFLISLLYQNSPKDLKFILIDPKRVELSSYNNIPHLLSPVIEDPNKAATALKWIVAEMTRRYGELSANRVRNIFEYNELKNVNKLPKIVVVIDELADLMMTSGKDVEAAICRIAQMARAVGIHLVIATQRPSVDVITGLIKANIPSRISFAVSSSIDSRTILDGTGAEDLLGRGDMLYLPSGKSRPLRIQGIYITTEEIERVTNNVKLTVEPDYEANITSVEGVRAVAGEDDISKAGNADDSMYEEAYLLVKETGKASASLLQRRLKVGYARAARLIDLLEQYGVVGPANGAKPRKILI